MLDKFYYRDRYRSEVVLLLVALAIIAVLALVVEYKAINRGEPDYYATSSNGALVPLQPVSKKRRSPYPLLHWLGIK